MPVEFEFGFSTVVEFLPQVLTGLEPDLILPVTRNLQKLGIDVLLQAKAKGYSKTDGGLKVDPLVERHRHVPAHRT